MLLDIFKKLDKWIAKENKQAARESTRWIDNCEFKILGQAALLEADLDLSLARTADLDAYHNASHVVVQQLDTLLAEDGMHLDPLSNEIWMPEETTYSSIFEGEHLCLYIANPEFVLVSKVLKASDKNIDALVQYLAHEPTKLFFELCKKYQIDLDRLLDKIK